MGNVQRLGRRLPGLFQLIAIAEHRSINKAADALNISQSSLTRSLAALEAEIGVTLFERSARGVRLTVSKPR
jgi:DNA-binding transcriptional LysR family regulator